MILNKPPETVMTENEVKAIVDYAMGKIRADPLIATALMVPFTAPLVMAQLDSTSNALYAGLRPFIGRQLGEIPNDLGKLEEVRKGIFGFTGVGDVVSTGWVGDLIAGLGGVAAKGGVLIGIVVLGLIGVRMLVGGSAIPLRRFT